MTVTRAFWPAGMHFITLLKHMVAKRISAFHRSAVFGELVSMHSWNALLLYNFSINVTYFFPSSKT